MNANDPSWILSSTIQGAATAIAIIAGFSIQQFLLAQSAEDNAQFELGILQNKIEKARSDIAGFKSNLDEVTSNIYKPKVLGLIEMFPNYDADQIWKELAEKDQEDFSLEKVKTIYELVQEALQELNSKITPPLIPQISETQLVSLGINLSNIDLEIYLTAVSVYRSQHNQNWLSRNPGFRNALTGLTGFNLQLTEARSNIYGNLNEANADLRRLYEEESKWVGRLGLAKNSFSIMSFAIHSFLITVVGIAIPAFLLSKHHLSNSHNYRLLYLGLILGVVAIALSYFTYIVKKRINKPKKE